MNICLFGGTFDPIHKGHLAIAGAAAQRFGLRKIIFVPAATSPFKQAQTTAPYHHRLAMIALATAGERNFRISDFEAPKRRPSGPNYSIDTVRHFRKTLDHSDRLFFLTGADSFSAIAKWKNPESLLRECEFIVVSRPGYSLADIAAALPDSIRPNPRVLPAVKKQARGTTMIFGEVTLNVLGNVKVPISSTQIRGAIAARKSLSKYLEASVAEYIKKNGLYSITQR